MVSVHTYELEITHLYAHKHKYADLVHPIGSDVYSKQPFGGSRGCVPVTPLLVKGSSPEYTFSRQSKQAQRNKAHGFKRSI